MTEHATTLMPSVVLDNNQSVNVNWDTTTRMEHVNQVSI